MTSEVCVMNRHGLVLAADSAITASAWVDGKREERYFKGANKIFQLSNHQPVALMFFDSADVLRVPWEVVVKEFRASLADKSFNTIDEYAKEFFAYIEQDKRLFPEAVQKDVFVSAARGLAIATVFGADRPNGQSHQELLDAIDAVIVADHAQIMGVPLSPGVTQDVVERAVALYGAEARAEIVQELQELGLDGITQTDALVEHALQSMLRFPEVHFSTTGLVVAGYGDHDVFPSMVEYQVRGLFADKLILKREQDAAVTHDIPAAINAFAQTSMSDTFQLGFSMDSYSTMSGLLSSELAELVKKVDESHGVDPKDHTALVTATKDTIMKGWIEKARTTHVYPLRRVLSSLPLDEMADLAETLINLQSLKEKVTKPSESVGGPTDVAVLTKNEGLVWIRRKHWFDARLNPRFMQRQAALHR